MFLVRRSRFKGSVLLAAVAFVAYLVMLQPAWAIDPLRSFGERVLDEGGVAAVGSGLWMLVVVILFSRKPLMLIRKWRIVMGSALLMVGLQGLLSYFEATLPLVGLTNLGGRAGEQVQGPNTVLSYLRVALVLSLAIYTLAPRLINRMVGGTKAKELITFDGPEPEYHAVPAKKGLVHVLGAGLRGGKSVAKVGGMAVSKARVSKKDGRLASDLGVFFASAKANYDQNRENEPSPAEEERDSPLVVEDNAPPRQSKFVVEGNDDVVEPVEVIAPKRPKETKGRVAKRIPNWLLPNIGLLAPGVSAGVITDEHNATAGLIEETLAEHGVEVSVAEIKPGPSVTMFGLVPGWNRRLRAGARGRSDEGDAPAPITETRGRVRVDAILAREKDLALALAAPSLRLEAPVPGESVVGVEVPNRSTTTVTIRKVMDSDEYQNILEAGGLPVALGLASAGEPVAIDLLKMPHLLIAGATGSGKSVCMNSIISSIIAHQPPSRVRMMLVDPKRVELTPYNGVPHLVAPVVTNPDRVVRLLRGAIEEMGRRYKLLEEAGVRNIQSYNASLKATEDMPYFVICIDELADLMMTASFEVEQGICRLAQLGRATGIHMVVATQRPSVDVVTGLIKANFPSRISFAVASQVDSRTILDSVGAERLLGRGDMLYQSSDAAKPRRVQGVLITEEETDLLADHWREHPDLPLPKVALEDMAREAEVAAAEQDADLDEGDSMYAKALKVAAANGRISTSLLQSRLSIGYPRARRLMEQLEEEGVVGASAGPGKPREVIVAPSDI
jgi:DNA segregation ATPase FtsK/SpoIIIE-like protein